ncbi:transcriptional regulator, IclR family [Halogranum rubrum]|uniref:Transcriptional regulator, IclR family n=1 Tax=Halogranum rubrum TaxID=553466 RepID=A0A1I4JQX8_9EURY|nr:IclR family transcriptional regulator [Halogranum rubrum]SFL68617.1 transcriptional regulator, IclR family [Halogranum rubrum]
MVEKETDEKSYAVKTTVTSFRILEAVHELEKAGVSEISEALGLSKSTVYKHLSTLESTGYVLKEDGSYKVSLGFLRFGEAARMRKKIYQVAKDHMEELASKTNEMSNLVVEEQGRGILLYRATSNKAVSLDTYVGKEVPLHSTGNGKAILAHLPRQRVEEIIAEHGLPKASENTITEPEALFKELESIRERGWAYDEGERIEGLRCVAVPIMTPEEVVLGAISVSGPASRIEGDRFREELPDLLLRAKNVIEMDIAYK